MSLIAVALLPVLAVAVIVWLFYQVTKNHEFYRNIPEPPPLPFFGHVFEVSSTKDILHALHRFAKEYGGIYKLRMGPIRKGIIVSDYKFLEFVLSSTKVLDKAEEYLYFRPWLGTGLLTSDGPKWKKHRRILTPAFHFQILEHFIHVFEQNGQLLIKKLESKVGEKSFDVYPFVTLCALDVICESAMGTTVNAQTDENSIYVQSVKNMCKVVMERCYHVLELSDITFPFTKNYYIQKKSLKVLHRQTNDVIKARKEELKSSGAPDGNENDVFITKNKKPFLDLLLNATVDGRPLTQEEIREEVDTFMFEGHDTTAAAISFALFSLANHPDVQEKAYEEQKQIFGGKKQPAVTHTDLQNMKYLEMVIKETLRLYPSVPFYGRKTTEPVEYNGAIIPEGIRLMIFAYGIHRNPLYFEDPDAFKPSRFETIDGTMPYAYIPFSAGPRNCIGQKFAMLEMKSTISMVLRNYVLKPASPEHKLELAAEAILKSVNGINIALNHRN